MSLFNQLKDIASQPFRKHIYSFRDGSSSLVDTIGYKGSKLCEMVKLGLPVPNGFIISSAIGREMLEQCESKRKTTTTPIIRGIISSLSCAALNTLASVAPIKMSKSNYISLESSQTEERETVLVSISPAYIDEIRIAIRKLERETNKIFGSEVVPVEDASLVSIIGSVLSANPSQPDANGKGPKYPLIVSVRPSAPYPMSGTMDAVLNVGMNLQVMNNLAELTGNRWFALDTYRRFLQSFGCVVLGIEKIRFDSAHTTQLKSKRYLDTVDLEKIVEIFLSIVESRIPDDPWQQLNMALHAVLSSWNSLRAASYRDICGYVSTGKAPAIIIQSMVFGNLNAVSGCGVCFTRNPCSGENVMFGEYFPFSGGGDASEGFRDPSDLSTIPLTCLDTLQNISRLLEGKFGNMQCMEFTVENGSIFILQTKSGNRSPKASIKIAVSMVSEHLIHERQALAQIDTQKLRCANVPCLEDVGNISKFIIAKGIASCAGTVHGKVAFTKDELNEYISEGSQVIWCQDAALVSDVEAFRLSTGVLTIKGSATSQAADILRAMGKVAVTGAGYTGISEHKAPIKLNRFGQRILLYDGSVVSSGDYLTLDGSTGFVYIGKLNSKIPPRDEDFETVLRWSNRYKRMLVMAQIHSVDDISVAVQNGADGIGLLATEYMFRSREEMNALKQLIVGNPELKPSHLSNLLGFQSEHMLTAFRLMRNRPIYVRLLYPIQILGNLLSKESLSVSATEARELIELIEEFEDSISQLSPFAVAEAYPDIVSIQTQAILGSACIAFREGLHVRPRIIIPFYDEIGGIIPTVIAAAEETFQKYAFRLDFEIGFQIEAPHACIVAKETVRIEEVRFMTIDTSHLTERIYGPSSGNQAHNNLLTPSNDPFATIDLASVGSMLKSTVDQVLYAKRDMQIGICGGHCKDAKSVSYFDNLGVDFVVALADDVATTKLAAAQAHIKETVEPEY